MVRAMAPGIGPGDPMVFVLTRFRGGNDYADAGRWLLSHRLMLPAVLRRSSDQLRVRL